MLGVIFEMSFDIIINGNSRRFNDECLSYTTGNYVFTLSDPHYFNFMPIKCFTQPHETDHTIQHGGDCYRSNYSHMEYCLFQGNANDISCQGFEISVTANVGNFAVDDCRIPFQVFENLDVNDVFES